MKLSKLFTYFKRDKSYQRHWSMNARVAHAIRHKNLDRLQFLMSIGGKPNMIMPGRLPALHYAAAYGDIETLAYLVKQGASLDTRFYIKPGKAVTAAEYAELYGPTANSVFLRKVQRLNDQTSPDKVALSERCRKAKEYGLGDRRYRLIRRK